jgi:hypothetical protein
MPLPQRWRRHALRLRRQGEAVVEDHALAQPCQRGVRDFPFHLHPVGLGQFPARIADACLQRAAVGQQQQTLGIMIQAPGRMHAGQGNEVRQGRPVLFGAELAEHLEGLVEKDQAGHGGRLHDVAAKLA